MNANWFAIYVKSRTEKKVGELLLNKGVEAYVPLVKTMRQWSDRKKMVEIPLFSGYVFVKIDAANTLPVLQTKGVVGFVKYLGKNAVLREVEIVRLKQLVNLGYQIDAFGIDNKYKPGQKVKITSGVLQGLEAMVLDSNDAKMIEIVLENIGQVIRVKLPTEIIIPLVKI